MSDMTYVCAVFMRYFRLIIQGQSLSCSMIRWRTADGCPITIYSFISICKYIFLYKTVQINCCKLLLLLLYDIYTFLNNSSVLSNLCINVYDEAHSDHSRQKHMYKFILLLYIYMKDRI